MREYSIVPASTGNQITKEYYCFLVEQINNRTSSQKVQRVLRQNGSYIYHTYHLVTV